MKLICIPAAEGQKNYIHGETDPDCGQALVVVVWNPATADFPVAVGRHRTGATVHSCAVGRLAIAQYRFAVQCPTNYRILIEDSVRKAEPIVRPK